MEKRMLLFVALFFTSTMSISAQPDGSAVKKNGVRHRVLAEKMVSSYLASLVLSGCIGAATGGVARYLEKRLDIESSSIAFFLMLLGWALESEFRNDVVIGLQKDLDAYQVEYKKGLMFKTAWIASWLSYLQG